MRLVLLFVGCALVYSSYAEPSDAGVAGENLALVEEASFDTGEIRGKRGLFETVAKYDTGKIRGKRGLFETVAKYDTGKIRGKRASTALLKTIAG